MIIEPDGLNVLEFARARKAIALGQLTVAQWDKANAYQKSVLHHIELTMESLTVEDLATLEEEYDPTRR